MKNFLYFLVIFGVACSTPSSESEQNDNAQDSTVVAEQPSSPATGVFFTNISDGDVLTSPFVIEMGIEGMIVEPKGKPREGYGHHHLFINDMYKDAGIFIPADSTHIHYGGGQTSDTVELAPGKYYLCLQFADGMHMSYGEEWSRGVTVTVE